MSKISETISGVKNKNLEAATASFKGALSERAATVLEEKKIVIAKNLLGQK